VNQPTDPERIRVAHHEAGHALVAELLGVRVDVVSARAAERHRGVTIHASLQVDEIGELLARRDGSRLLARWGVTPYPLFDPEERRRAECLIMISLAGHLGELLMPEFVTGYRDDSADIDQAQAIATAVELTVEQDRWLVDAENTEIPADDEHAFATSRGITGDEGAAALVNHLTWETRRLMFSPLVQSLVPPIVDQLLRHDAIPGETLREIVQRITGETLKHEEATTMVRAAAKQVGLNTPRISGDTPISQLVVCTRAIIRAKLDRAAKA
jgi:hypothetical protein